MAITEYTDDAPVGTTITTVTRRRTPVRIPAARYTDPAWAELEEQRVWTKTWQLACTLDHLANPGDWYEYTVGKYSVLIVRDDDGALRAYQNVCRAPRQRALPRRGQRAHRDPLRLPPVVVGSARPTARGAVAQGLRRAAQRRVPALPRARRHVGAVGLRQPRHQRHAVGRVSRAGARRHRVGRYRRVPLPRRRHRAVAGQLEGLASRRSARRTTCRASIARCCRCATTSIRPRRSGSTPAAWCSPTGCRRRACARSPTTSRCGRRSSR